MSYKKIAFFTIVVILLLTINDLVHSIYDIWQKQDLVLQAQKDLDTEKRENQELKKQITTVNQSQFIESQARNKLLLAKPGEDVIIVPNSQLATAYPQSKPIDNRPNWKKWWSIFF